MRTYFLGANTPEGFRSEYGSLQTDRRIEKLWILKGGSGCGKSTLMRLVAARAEQLGLSCEQILCSSDPDSLDALVVPEAGIGIVDGTAPHVVEPTLCGVGSNYVNLGICYNEDLLRPLEPALRAAKEAAGACRAPAYAALAASAAVLQLIRGLGGLADASEALRRAREELLAKLPEPGKEPGPIRRCYFTGVTPAGLKAFVPQSRRLWSIRDCFGLGSELIRELARRWSAAGETVVLGMDPLDPDRVSGLFLPGRDMGYWRVDPVFDPPEALLCLDLERPVLEALPQELRSRIGNLIRLRRELLTESVYWLSQAKKHHEVLEELYRPAVDFSAVEREAETIARSLLTETSA